MVVPSKIGAHVQRAYGTDIGSVNTGIKVGKPALIASVTAGSETVVGDKTTTQMLATDAYNEIRELRGCLESKTPKG